MLKTDNILHGLGWNVLNRITCDPDNSIVKNKAILKMPRIKNTFRPIFFQSIFLRGSFDPLKMKHDQS